MEVCLHTEGGAGRALGYYERGATTYFAAQADQRFGYYLYVPRDFSFDESGDYRLCVIVHGTGRTPSVYRDLFAEFAEANRVIVLAPLFPAGIIEPGDLSNYKFIKFHDIRYDHVLLGMVDEVADRFELSERRFLMFGFSGGAQFAHRFAYLHAARLIGLSVGAPGVVSLLDNRLPWWRGTADLVQVMGQGPDLDGLRALPVQLVAGADDVDTWEITLQPGSRWWMEGANDAGRTRLDRLETLAASLKAQGISVRVDHVPGVAHNGYAVLEPVKAFLGEVLEKHRVNGGRK